MNEIMPVKDYIKNFVKSKGLWTLFIVTLMGNIFLSIYATDSLKREQDMKNNFDRMLSEYVNLAQMKHRLEKSIDTAHIKLKQLKTEQSKAVDSIKKVAKLEVK